jgi:hypothetical protein
MHLKFYTYSLHIKHVFISGFQGLYGILFYKYIRICLKIPKGNIFTIMEHVESYQISHFQMNLKHKFK